MTAPLAPPSPPPSPPVADGPLRALLVAYSFPPVGGAGVQRMLKLAKYLPLHGVSPAVLTVANPSVPLRDETLMADVPATLPIVRARTLEPGYAVKQAAWSASTSDAAPSLRKRATRALSGVARQLLFPDPQVLWQPGASAALVRRLAAGADDVVVISGPPFSQFLLAPLARAPLLSRRVAVVLDYRDEWSTLRKSYEMTRSGLQDLLGDPLEAALLRCAHAVVTATPTFRDNLLRRFPFLDPARVHEIPNGYDPADFPPWLAPPASPAAEDPARAALPPLPTDRLVLTYAGTVFRLTSPRGLLGAVRRLHREEPALAARLSLRFIGRIVDTELDAFAGTEALGVSRVDYLSHHDVLQELLRSHATLCLLDDVAGADAIFPGKVFELMYLRRPCLTLAPPGALAQLAQRHALGAVLHPRDEVAIAGWLAQALREHQQGRFAPSAASQAISRFSRPALAGEFAAVLRAASAQARR